MTVYTEKGNKVFLNEPPINSGGEGNIYEIQGKPGLLAKIYKDKSDCIAKEKKLVTMSKFTKIQRFKDSKVDEYVVWPMECFYDITGCFIGFCMNRVAAKHELDLLYAYPESKNASFNMSQKLEILINLCEAVHRTHIIGQFIGDFNPGNILVTDDGKVKLIDADSFYVRTTGEEYRCIVCASEYVAPEIMRTCKGCSFENYPGQTFTMSSDNFCLAVHIFRMLFNGCHPFTCAATKSTMGKQKKLENCIEKEETAFFKNIPGYTTPHFAPDIKAFPPYIIELFKKAFIGNPTYRPSAKEWKSALTKYKEELKQCKHNHQHFYWDGTKKCPYCVADERHQQATALAKATNSVPATSAQQNPAISPVPPITPTATAQTPATAPKTPLSASYWIASMAVIGIVQFLLYINVYPDIYWYLFYSGDVSTFGSIGSFFLGCLAGVRYNFKYAKDDMMEIIPCVFFSLFGAAMFGVGTVVVGIALYALALFVVCAILYAFLSGS